MPKQVSSPRKRTAKAGTRRRSTTSSTTGNAAERPEVAPEQTVRDVAPLVLEGSGAPSTIPVLPEHAELLNASQQDEFLEWFARGASPAMACQPLGISVTSFLKTLDEDETFNVRVQQTQSSLSQNVAARLYRTSMEGNVSAQRYYLELRPPPEWKQTASIALNHGELEPDELADEYRAAGLEVPAELQALVGHANGSVEP